MTALGNSMVGQFIDAACIAQNYVLNDIMTGCMIFNGVTFATLGFADTVTSTASWAGAGGTNAIIFSTDKTAQSSICFPPPIAPPVAAPVTAPIAAPVAAPVATPVAAAPVVPPATAPVAAPVAAVPVAPPVTAPVAAPVAAPTTVGNTSIIAIIIGALLSIAGAIIAVVFCIW